MAQNITLLGATYSNVPAVDLPKQGGGTASFTDVTDTTAAAADVAQGKYFYLSNGTRTEGTATGGGGGDGSVWQDAQGFVNLDDDPGTHVEVDTLNVTTNGTYTAPTGHAYSPVTVNVSGGGGGGGVEPKTVNFYDYDGTCLHAYTANEFAQLAELPSNPTHDGLVAKGWNWTKTQISDQLSAAAGGVVNVGQMYETASGATEIDVYFPPTYKRLSPYLNVCVNGTISIDWGDNTTPDTLTGTNVTSRQSVSHTYSSPGEYTISIDLTSGESYGFYNTQYYTLLGANDTSSNERNAIYYNAVRAIRLGEGPIAVGNYCFAYLTNLEYLTMSTNTVYTGFGTYGLAYCRAIKYIALSNSLTSIGTYSFYNCTNLKTVSLPGTITALNSYGFNTCNTLTAQTIPYQVTSIPGTSLGACLSLSSVVVPSGVTSIGASAFSSCYGMAEIHFKSTTPPTVSNNNAFSTLPTDCKFYVPSASLTDYQTANIWSTYSSRIEGE